MPGSIFRLLKLLSYIASFVLDTTSLFLAAIQHDAVENLKCMCVI